MYYFLNLIYIYYTYCFIKALTIHKNKCSVCFGNTYTLMYSYYVLLVLLNQTVENRSQNTKMNNLFVSIFEHRIMVCLWSPGGALQRWRVTKYSFEVLVLYWSIFNSSYFYFYLYSTTSIFTAVVTSHFFLVHILIKMLVSHHHIGWLKSVRPLPTAVFCSTCL